MKRVIGVVLLTFSLNALYAQEEVKEDIKQAGKEVKKGAKKAGEKTAEVASKGKAKVTDQVYADKVGPNGETIYMDNHSKYYWVDKNGRRNYVKEEQLKAKAEE